MNQTAPKTFTALVLAGQRNPDDPLVRQTGASCKAMIEINGAPMLVRVLDTLAESAQVGDRMLSGPEQQQVEAEPVLDKLIESGAVAWQPPQPTPSTSAYRAMQEIDADSPVLVTTADHPLLTAEIVDEFCSRSRGLGLDVAVGLAPYERVQQTFPGMKKTVLRFREGNYCGCNLFAFLTPQGRRVADYWQKVERERKNPFKVIRALGWISVIQYLLGTLTLSSALERLSRQLNLRAGAVLLPYAEAAVDVDSVSDHDIVQRKLARGGNRPA